MSKLIENKLSTCYNKLPRTGDLLVTEGDKMIKSLIFDMDGVLTDTASVSVELVTSYFEKKGLKIKKEDVVNNLGKGMRKMFLDSAGDIGASIDVDDALKYSREVYSALLEKRERMKGVNEMLERAEKCGVRVAVASSAPLWRVEANISSLGLDGSYFDAVITEEDIKRNKPFPDIFTLAMIKLGVDGKEAVVFEDSEAGIIAGKKSGAYTCALTTSLSRDKMKSLSPSFIIEDLAHFPEFNSIEMLEGVVKELMNIKKGAKKYGANWRTPLERTLSPSVVEKKAIEEAKRVMLNAYAPYSGFKVGAAVLSAATGRIYSGCNMENASYGATICAERNAITTAVANEGAIGIELVVVASESLPPAQPCAVCLQVMSEFIRPETPVVLVSTKGETEHYVYSDLLPHPFEFGE